MQNFSTTSKNIAYKIERIRSEFNNIGMVLDWDIKSASGIDRTILQINNEMSKYVSALNKYQTFFNESYLKYVQIDQSKITESASIPTTQQVVPKKIKPIHTDLLRWFIVNPKPLHFFEYTKDFLTFFRSDKSGFAGYKNLLNLMDSSASGYEGIYELVGKLSGKTTELNNVFGSKISVVGLIGNAVGLSKSVLILRTDKTGSVVANWLDVGKYGVKFSESTYIMTTGATKVLPYVRIAASGITTISEGIRSYKEYSADGTYDLGDISATGIDASISGLNELFCFGLLDAKTISSEIKESADNWGAQAGNYILNNESLFNAYKNTNGFGRFVITSYSIVTTPIRNIGTGVATTAADVRNGIARWLIK